MRGHLTIIPTKPKEGEPFWTKPLTAPPTLDELRKIVGGYIEVVPGFTIVMFKSEPPQDCVAFCNEDGKNMGLPRNVAADALWQFSLKYRGHPGLLEHHADGRVTMVDHLVGDIAVVTGDDELLEAL